MHFFGLGTPSVAEVSKTLYQDSPAGKLVGKPGNMLSIAERIVKRFGENLRHEQGKIGIGAFPILIGVAVYGFESAVIFHGYESARAHAESPRPVAIFG